MKAVASHPINLIYMEDLTDQREYTSVCMKIGIFITYCYNVHFILIVFLLLSRLLAKQKP